MAAPLAISIVTPAPPGVQSGNRTTAARWARHLRDLGHEVELAATWDGARADALIALHAKKSAASIARFRAANPGRPLIVALTGTDLYGDLDRDAEALSSLALADRLVVLQPRGIAALPADFRARARTIIQSASAPSRAPAPVEGAFEVAVIGHLRAVKDPFRAAEASRSLPEGSRVLIQHAGAALDPGTAERARAEMARSPRYRWLGELPYAETQALLARARLLLLTSLTEGGANVVTEAIAAGVPVLSTRIEGSLGLLGEDYPGYFDPGGTEALAQLLLRAELDEAFLAELRRRCVSLAPLVDPAREREAWRLVLEEIVGDG